MGQTKFVLMLCLLFCAMVLRAGTYELKDGSSVNSDPVSCDKSGVVFKNNLAKRIAWTQFTQEALHTLKAERPQDADFITPFFEENIKAAEQQQKIEIKPVTRVELPKGRTGLLAGLGSPLGLVIFLAIYGANLLAASEIAKFKNYPMPVVCGAAAAVPILAPIAFLFVPARPAYEHIEEIHPAAPEPAAEPPPEPEPSVAHSAETAAPSTAPMAPSPAPRTPRPTTQFSVPTKQKAPSAAEEPAVAQPEAGGQPLVTFDRKQFTFNRRFFETKLPGFLRVVPGEAEKDMVLQIRCARGEFIGKRISKITPTEIHLEVPKEGASSEEMIPFNEIYEIKMRHKDSV